jgi:RimJ/RimL family protein N-acetyltransferase
MSRLGRMELRGDGISLRSWRFDDAPVLETACRDPEISRWIPFVPRPYSHEDAETYIRECVESGDERYASAIVNSATDRVLGSMDLRLNAQRYRGHVGYWVAAEARGRGVCTSALRMLSRWAFRELELVRLELITDPENVASQRVAEKVGYQREGVLRGHLMHPDGRVRDSVMFSLLPGELRG